MQKGSLAATADRRLHKRVPDNGSGVAVLYPNFVFSIDVLDISKGGLSFTYKGWEKWSERELMLDYVTGENFVTKVPCEIVSDIPLDKKTALRRCGLRFKELSAVQQAQIAELLQLHEEEAVRPPVEKRKAPSHPRQLKPAPGRTPPAYPW